MSCAVQSCSTLANYICFKNVGNMSYVEKVLNKGLGQEESY